MRIIPQGYSSFSSSSSSSLPPGFNGDRAIPSVMARGQHELGAQLDTGGGEAGSHLNRGLFLFSASSGGTKDMGVRGTMFTACGDENRSVAATARGRTGGAGTAWAAPPLAAPGDEKAASRLPYAGLLVLPHVHAALAGVLDVVQGEELQREARGGDRLAAGPGTMAPRGARELLLHSRDQTEGKALALGPLPGQELAFKVPLTHGL